MDSLRPTRRSEEPNGRRPRDMVPASVSLLAVSLIWAGTHQIGITQMEGINSFVEWMLAVGLLIAGGALLASLLIPVDIRQRFDFWTFCSLGGLPILVLGYGVYTLSFGPVRGLDKMLGWAIPYGLTAMGVVVGFALAAAVRVKPRSPIVTDEQLSTLSISDTEC